MKKMSVAALLAGLLLILIGVFFIDLFIPEEVAWYLAEQGKFSLLTLGGVMIFYGLVGRVFHEKLSKWISLPTVSLALAIAAAVSLGIHSGLSMLSCFVFSNPSRHPIRYPASICLGLVCLGAFFCLLYKYCKVRGRAKSVLGTILDALLGLSFCVPLYFLWVTADNFFSSLI